MNEQTSAWNDPVFAAPPTPPNNQQPAISQRQPARPRPQWLLVGGLLILGAAGLAAAARKEDPAPVELPTAAPSAITVSRAKPAVEEVVPLLPKRPSAKKRPSALEVDPLESRR